MKRKTFFKKIPSEEITPLEIYMRFLDDKNSYFFESVEGGEKWAKYSIIGLPTDKKIKLSDSPLDEIDDFMKSQKVERIEGLPDFTGGLVGYFSYDTIRHIEKKLSNSKKPQLNYAEISLMISDELIVYDNYEKNLFIIVNDFEKNEKLANSRIDEILQQINTPLEDQENSKKNKIEFSSSVSKKDYLQNVKNN